MYKRSNTVIFAIVGVIIGLAIGYAYYRPEKLTLQNEVSTLMDEIVENDNTIEDIQTEIDTIRNEIEESHNNYDELLDEYNSQARRFELEVENMNNKYDDLLSEKNMSEEKYEEILNNYIELLKIYPFYEDPLSVYYDDFYDHYVSDPDHSLSISPYTASWFRMDRSIVRKIWRSYRSSLTGDFAHKFTFNIEEIDAGDRDNREIVRFWSLEGDDVSLICYAEQEGSRSDRYNMVFFQRNETGNLFEYYSSVNNDPLLVGEQYYATITKQEDTYRFFVFDNSGIIMDSGSLQGISFDYRTITLVSVGGYSTDLDDWSSGYFENFKIYD